MTTESSTTAPPATSELLATVGNKVRAMRKEKGMTLAKLSDITGLSQAIVSQIERGMANPSFTTLAQLAHGLDTPDRDGTIEAQWISTPPGHDTSATPFTHSGEEFCYIISGRKDVYLDGVCYSLEEGDSISYPAETPHWYKNSYEEVCVAIWVNAPHKW